MNKHTETYPTQKEEGLLSYIKEHIRRNGYMPFDQYMSLCLGHPQYGYYMRKDPFGQKGDFVTAPEISQLFGEMIGAWLYDSWQQMRCPDPFLLVEAGPGRGTLIADALRALKNKTDFLNAAKLHLIETSPILQKKQEEALHIYKPVWHHDIAMLPSHAPVIFVANEFLDALPVFQMIYTATGWNEKIIYLDSNDTLCFGEKPLKRDVSKVLPPTLFPYKEGDVVEVSPEQNSFLKQLAKIMSIQGGVALFLDYGFTHAGCGDTVQAMRNHRYCSVLDTPGQVDITSHVNFCHVASQMMEMGLTAHGPVSQGSWLNALGISIRLQQLSKRATPEQAHSLRQEVKRLTGSSSQNHEMGDLFKVIAFSAKPDIVLAGLSQ